jgi:Zn-dependent protease with chaperone function
MTDTSYRYPGEQSAFVVALLIVLAVLAISAVLTFFIAPVLVVIMLAFSYYGNQSMHTKLVRTATHVDARTAPELTRIAIQAARRLGVHGVEVYLVRNAQRNAYTFGLSKPQNVVVYSSLLEIMDADELTFVIGHELGHVALDHTWLNTLLGGMAGVPTTLGLSVIVTLAFRSWNRGCEYSADRAGLIACGSLNKAILTLAELAAGDIRSDAQFQQVMAALEKQDDSFADAMSERLASHPMIIKRIKELQKFAASEQYRRLTAGLA